MRRSKGEEWKQHHISDGLHRSAEDPIVPVPASTKEPQLATPSSTWYVDFFRDDYLNVYNHLFTAERTEKEIVFAEHALELRAGARILDLCCGQGRHSVLFARRGFQVTGLDLNAAYLDTAQESARASNVTLKTIKADMRQIPFQDQFDAIVNMYSSFGYLESEAEDQKVLESAAKAIRPGGRLMLDMLNREWAVTNYIQNDWHSGGDGTLYVERRDLDLASSRMHVKFTIIGPHGGRRDSVGHHIRLYTLTETTRLLQQVGLNVTGVFGGFDAEPYAIGTRRMIVLAQKGS
jgi:2-polyprenyl-3-methyl-5-hydroxy-6-metoxy-1,4-benzoquinol methylase